MLPGRGRSEASLGDEGGGGVPGEPGPQILGPGQDQGPGLADGLGAFAAALRLATISARIASTAPSRPLGAPRARPDWAARAALTASSGSDLPCRRRSWRSERSTSTTRMPAAVTWRARPGAVTAGSLDPDQAYGPEPAQPAQQAGVTGRGGRELPDAEQPADRIERRGDMRICVGVHAAGDGACFFYDGHSHPFLRLRDGTHPLARRNCEPRPLVQAGQIRPAPLAGAI